LLREVRNRSKSGHFLRSLRGHAGAERRRAAMNLRVGDQAMSVVFIAAIIGGEVLS
jgi:hypothetical protein